MSVGEASTDPGVLVEASGWLNWTDRLSCRLLTATLMVGLSSGASIGVSEVG